MLLLAAALKPDSGSIPFAWWGWAVAAMFLATGLGFVAGLLSARACEQRAYRRARSGVAPLFHTVLKLLDASRETCTLLERQSGQFLEADQTEQLEQKRAGLLDVISRIISRNRPASTESPDTTSPHTTSPHTTADSSSAPFPLENLKINWLLNPVDPATSLPGRQAFESNLGSLLELGRKTQQPSSLLLVRIDKLSGLTKRLGKMDTGKLVRKMAGVICRAVRDQDLVCQYAPDLIAALLPGVDAESGARLARTVRDSVRNYHFRVEENGPEVLFTASFGCTPCDGDSKPELVLNRAVDALSKSERLGRNQLHVFDGELLVHCTAGA